MSESLILIKTGDGSHTLFVPELNEHYHSTYGAIQESKHIFIEAGLRWMIDDLRNSITTSSDINDPSSEHPVINLLEIGFGTGLNALLTLIEAQKTGIPIHYTSIEANPLGESIWRKMNYPELLCSSNNSLLFEKLHLTAWNKVVKISPLFSLHKIHKNLENFHPVEKQTDLVYFDAFNPEVQPFLWTEQIFRNLFCCMVSGGILVTYSVKGIVTRALKAAGFIVEQLPGPPGKRQMLRAKKPMK